MRWYDYLVVFFMADAMSAAVMVGDILSLALFLIGYFAYEAMRKENATR